MEAPAAVEIDGGIAVGDFEVEVVGSVLARGGFGEVEEFGANSLSAMSAQDEELVDPGALAAIFETEVEADDEVGNRGVCVERQVDDAVDGIGEELEEIVADGRFVEGFGPGVVDLHLLHKKENGVEIGGGGRAKRDRHQQPFECGNEIVPRDIVNAGRKEL